MVHELKYVKKSIYIYGLSVSFKNDIVWNSMIYSDCIINMKHYLKEWWSVSSLHGLKQFKKKEKTQTNVLPDVSTL